MYRIRNTKYVDLINCINVFAPSVISKTINNRKKNPNILSQSSNRLIFIRFIYIYKKPFSKHKRKTTNKKTKYLITNEMGVYIWSIFVAKTLVLIYDYKFVIINVI